MSSRHFPIAHRCKVQYKKVYALPIGLRYIVGVGIILLGVLNLANPFVNGIFLIIVGGSLFSTATYKVLKKKRKVYKLRHNIKK